LLPGVTCFPRYYPVLLQGDVFASLSIAITFAVTVSSGPNLARLLAGRRLFVLVFLDGTKATIFPEAQRERIPALIRDDVADPRLVEVARSSPTTTCDCVFNSKSIPTPLERCFFHLSVRQALADHSSHPCRITACRGVDAGGPMHAVGFFVDGVPCTSKKLFDQGPTHRAISYTELDYPDGVP
jgi:hypothetical protein